MLAQRRVGAELDSLQMTCHAFDGVIPDTLPKPLRHGPAKGTGVGAREDVRDAAQCRPFRVEVLHARVDAARVAAPFGEHLEDPVLIHPRQICKRQALADVAETREWLVGCGLRV